MKNVVIFTEGKGEVIFTRHILTQVVGYDKLSFECLELLSDKVRPAGWIHRNPNALINFVIINVGTDERVISEIEARYKGYMARGFDVIGLRDMFCENYERKLRKINQVDNVIDDNVNASFIQDINNRILRMGNVAGSTALKRGSA